MRMRAKIVLILSILFVSLLAVITHAEDHYVYVEDDFIFEDLDAPPATPADATPSDATLLYATPSNATPITATPSNAMPATPANAIMLTATADNAAQVITIDFTNILTEKATPADATPADAEEVITIDFTNILTEKDDIVITIDIVNDLIYMPQLENSQFSEDSQLETPQTTVSGGSHHTSSSHSSSSTSNEKTDDTTPITIIPDDTEQENENIGSITANYDHTQTIDKSDYYINKDGTIEKMNRANFGKTGDDFNYGIILLLIPLPVLLLFKRKRRKL